MAGPRIAFIGAGSTVFMKNLIGDCLLRPALGEAHVALMDIDQTRLDDLALKHFHDHLIRLARLTC